MNILVDSGMGVADQVAQVLSMAVNGIAIRNDTWSRRNSCTAFINHCTRSNAMKKKIAALVLVASLATAGIASARGGMGMGMGMGCPQMPPQAYQQVDAATQGKIDAFFRDTQDLRKKIVMKHAEMRALMNNQNADPAAASKLSGELFDLQVAIQDKAKAAGVDQYVGGCGMGMGMGMGMGKGPHGGRGMMMGARM